MRIVTWNVNGLRSLLRIKGESLKFILDSLGGDIICLQETKTTRDQLDSATALADGYSAYFSFCQLRPGYSGVVTFCRDTCRPFAAEEGLASNLSAPAADSVGCYGWDEGEGHSVMDVDLEGRAVLTQHRVEGLEGSALVVVNVYCPHVEVEREDRHQFKLSFYHALQKRVVALQSAGKWVDRSGKTHTTCVVVVAGDFNCSYNAIDSAYALDDPSLYKGTTPAQTWIRQFLVDQCPPAPPPLGPGPLVDSFRALHPSTRGAYTCWSTTTGARATNYGTRIDYIATDSRLAEQLISSGIQPQVTGSDHCPVYADLSLVPRAAPSPPSLCISHLPEFVGQQKTLKQFFAAQSIPCQVDSAGSTGCGLKRSASKGAESLAKQTCVSNNSCAPLPLTRTSGGHGELAAVWKSLFKGPIRPPLCTGHREPTVMRTVKKDGPNRTRRFFVCARPAGAKGNPEARCNFFQWIDKPPGLGR